MPYTYILDDSIKESDSDSDSWSIDSPISPRLFFFYKIKNFFFLLWVNLYAITDTYLHDPPPFNGPFFMTPPFSAVSKGCDPPSVSTPLPLLISDKSLINHPNWGERFLWRINSYKRIALSDLFMLLYFLQRIYFCTPNETTNTLVIKSNKMTNKDNKMHYCSF